MRPFDTTAEAQRAQDQAVMGLTGAERLRIAFELSRATRDLAFAGLKQRMGHASRPELINRLIEICYGPAALERAGR